jgi:hypothetical protein
MTRLLPLRYFPSRSNTACDERQFISFLTVDESKRKLSEVHIRLHCESGNRVVAFHRLDSQIDGQIMGLAVGEERLFDLAFRGIFGGGVLSRCEVSAAGGQHQLLAAIQCNFQRVKLAIKLYV